MAVGFPVGPGLAPLDFSHMKNGEIRWFKYQRSPFTKCQLRPSSTVLGIQIKKYKRKNQSLDLPPVPKGATRFRTWKMGLGDVYLDCHPGFVDKPAVRDVMNGKGKNARGCGIGRILMSLCMFEKKIHNTKFPKNKALKSLKPKFKKEMKWMKSQCSKVVMLKTDINIASTWKNLKTFLEDANTFGFTIMVIKVPWAPRVPEALYPKAGPCRTFELATNYKYGSMTIDVGPSVVVTGDGNEWFFCLPTKKRLDQGLPRCKK